MFKNLNELHGADVLISLAKIYKQLYIPPGDDSEEKYAGVVKRGEDVPGGNLSHFIMDSRDSLIYEDTPVGPVCIITLYNRADFVTFLRIMGNRCALVEIPEDQGAAILDGVINWDKIRAHRGDQPDKKDYLDTLIVLSVGPYSGIGTDIINNYLCGDLCTNNGTDKGRASISHDEWLSLSYTIRRYHECTHFICRRRYPDKKDAIWDELVADAVGIYAAFGRYDPGLEELFLGIHTGRYTGGRLKNYVSEVADEKKQEQLVEMSSKIIPVLEDFAKVIMDNPGLTPYDIAILLEERYHIHREMWYN